MLSLPTRFNFLLAYPLDEQQRKELAAISTQWESLFFRCPGVAEGSLQPIADWAWQELHGVLRDLRAFEAKYRPATKQPAGELVKGLRGWNEILEALGLKITQVNRRRWKYLNDLRDGPIIVGGRGKPPCVDRTKLIEWHNRLFLEAEGQRNRKEGASHEAAEHHAYGRTGTVAPALGGAVKKRRKDKR